MTSCSAAAAVRADQAQEEEERLLHRDLLAALVDEVQPLGRAVEDDAEVGADGAHEPARLRDRLLEPLARAWLLPLGGEGMRRDGLDAERAQHEREHERRSRVA